MNRSGMLLGIVACVAATASTYLSAEDTADSLPRAERNGHEITIQPAGPRFEVPAGWVRWHDGFHNNFFCTREELKTAEKGGGEWDTEYAEVMNAALDFTRCGFQGGGDGWGDKGAAFSDLQMRAYILPQSPEGIEQHLDDAGARAVAELLRPSRVAVRNGADRKGEPSPEEKQAIAAADQAAPPDPAQHRPTRSVAGDWRRSVWSFDLLYGDYGATANVDVRLRAFGSRTLALVFCYTNFQDQEPTIARILASVTWADPPEGK